jgi:hypothetical protein
MRRLLFLLGALCLVLGCASGDKAQWDEVWKDARGDNMQMRGFSGSDGTDRTSSLSKSRD